MDDKNLKKESTKDNGKPNNDTKEKKSDLDSTKESSSKENEKQKLNSNEDKNQKTKNLDTKNLVKEEKNEKDKKDKNNNTDKDDIKDKLNKEFLKDIDLIKDVKKNNYKKLYFKQKYCDFRKRENQTWRYGLILNILEDTLIINDMEERNREVELHIKIEDSSKLAYFRKYSEPSEKNNKNKRENKEELSNKLFNLEKLIKKEDLLKNQNSFNAWDIYYFLHSKIYFGLDSAMKINEKYSFFSMQNTYSDNEGAEESFKIILCILFFISKYFKYLLDYKEEFINYHNNIINTEFIDLKIVNIKCAFFSFFEESLNLLSKIFASTDDYLDWFQAFEEQLKIIIPSIEDQKIKRNQNICPLYENEKQDEKEEKGKSKTIKEKEVKEKDKEKKENKEKLILKKICLPNAYRFITTYTTNEIKIRAAFLAYFIDYFYALNGFSYLYQLCYCSDSINFQLLFKIMNGLSFAKSMTDNYRNVCIEEKKKLLQFIYDLFDKLNEKTIVEIKKSEIVNLLKKIPSLVALHPDAEEKIQKNLYFYYVLKKLLLSKKLEEKISSLNEINEYLKSLTNIYNLYSNNNQIASRIMTLEDFCVSCKKLKILQILLNDKNVHEEIIKRLPEILIVMYKNNFGYLKQEDEDNIKTDKKMIFNILFNKLLESEQNNQKLVKTIQNIICEICKIISKEDKKFVFDEIKKYLEKSIEKKGIPCKDHLSFIIDYSLRAIASTNSDGKEEKVKKEDKEEKEKNEEKEEKEERKKEKKGNNNEVKNRDNRNIENKKQEMPENKNEDQSVNIEINEDNFYGFNLLFNYLSETNYKEYNMTDEQKIELINSSIEGIIQIMDNYEKNDLLLKHIIFKVISMIKKSKDVIQYLILFEKIKKSKKLQSKANLFIEEYSKNYGLLSALISDMSRYLSLINNKSENEKEDKKDEGKIVYEGFFNNEINIKLRLELIFFLLQKNINEENWNYFQNEILSSCKKNKFSNECLNKYINNNLKQFDLKMKQFIYDNILSSKEKTSHFNDLQYYKLCKEIIKEINKENRIFYFMNNKDLAVLNCDSEKDIKGIDLLWNYLIKTKNDKIRNNVTEFLADIFFGIKVENQEKREKYWENFIKSIYDKLDEAIKFENENENKDSFDQSIQGIIALIKKIENKFTSKGDIIENVNKIKDEINLNKVEQISKLEQNEINKEKENIENKSIEKSKKIIFSGNIYGTDNKLNYDLKIDSTEYFYMFRYRLSSFFKIPVNLVKLILDESKNNEIQEQLKIFELDLFNDFDNTYSLIENMEKKLNLENKNKTDNENNLKFKVEVIKDFDKLKFIKKTLKDFPKLIKLLKRKNTEYILDVWYLIKEDSIKISPNMIEIIKEILNKENCEKLNNIFNFEDTNIYYVSYILFHLNNVINELNRVNEKFINDIFLKSSIWKDKIKNIKFENNTKPYLGEIYEKNNVINYLLNIFKLISQKTEDKNILLFILNKIFEYYYQTINECISINLKSLSSKEGIRVDIVEDLYITNTSKIKEIIIQNKIIYGNFIKILLDSNTQKESNKIRNQFEFLFTEGLIKNRIYSLNQKLQSFILTIADDNFFCNSYNEQENILINDFYLYLANFFLGSKTYHKNINSIKEIAKDKRLEVCLSIEKYENNIKLYVDIIINIIDKIYPVIFNKFNFNHFIKEIPLKHIYNPIIEEIPIELSYHQYIFGGYCKILLHLLTKSNRNKELAYLEDNEEKKLKHYLFEEIIMNKCNKNIFTEENIENYKSISISTPYAFKEATNLFIFLVMKKIENDNDSEINYYFDKLTELHKQCYWKGNGYLDWKLDYKESNKLSPFVGLKNLGCTCYMNSLLQIFFNFIPFRESLLKCKCKEEKKNSLYQIKKLFYSLKYLQVSYYTPTDFPNNFDDEILNVHLQMDVDEFFGNILEKIENRLKKTKNENLIKYFFQGRQNDILTFQDGCTHHRTNVNSFYSIQLQIQNKKNIYESLDTLIEGELMNGDNCIFCPECQKKFPAVKSQNFNTLPRMLIFVLKRFEFNYDTMRKVKINDYYEFPLELDMTKYISEKKSDTNLNKYSLKSVVVHMGNCEGGHYYAYIKTKNGQWYEFNDTQVTPFDINFLKEEAYGGSEIYNNDKHIEKDRSAYLLFYEKIDQSDCEQFDNIEAVNSFLGLNKKDEKDNKENIKNIQEKRENNIDMNKIENGGNINSINDDKNKENDNKNLGSNEEENEYGMKDILQNINKEMFKYFLNKKLFSNEYQYFILELYLNILNYYYNYELPIFLMYLCRNTNNRGMMRELNSINSNLNSYIDKNKLILFSNKEKADNKVNRNSEQILNLFKHFIIFFYNVFLRSKEKEYLGGMVDLIKFLMNDNPICGNYLIEEFCNKNVIIEYLINCPLYEIKKLVVGILYCAMIKSVNEYKSEILTKIGENGKMTKNNNSKGQKSSFSKEISDDEALARQLSNDMNGNENYIYNNNPLDNENIPKNILKMVYNILHLIRDMRYSNLNEQRFLYFTIYKFSLISEYTREFLINKCRLFELLCLLLHKNHATYSYDTNAIITSTYIGPYTVTHDILNTKGKTEETIIPDKGGEYKIENYIYLLFFYLLSYTPKDNSKPLIKEDSGYSLEDKDFIAVLLNNIRTKQDAFSFSNYINEKTKNRKSMIITVFDVLIKYLDKVDNNENINYDYNNYNNFVNYNNNENPNDNDPGINPKYLLLIIKRFISVQNLKNDYIQKEIKLIFRNINTNQIYYNYCIMLIDYIIELFSSILKGYSSIYKKDLEQLILWLQKYPISPSLYEIKGIFSYKYERKNYNSNISEEKKKKFNENEIEKTKKRINDIQNIIKNDPAINIEKYENEIDLSDFLFIIGDTILYDKKEAVIEEALDEQLKITIDSNKKNGKKEIWIEIDNPKIEIKELKGK